MSLNQKTILAADYLRLSRDDGDKPESDSIRNQRSLISEYVKQHSGITLVEEYVDDGYSGTNFDRPAFQRMIEDAKKKKINCIIVKDLSRLGRNYIETGRYLEKIFPFLGIRFIAVTDHYDSMEQKDDADQIIVPFKNLINDAYCRDISIKIRSQLDVKRKNGQFIGSFAGYGYKKDPENKNHLVIDEYAAGIVRMIFHMKMDGYSQQHIADHLNELGVLTPMEYKRRSGLNYNSGFRCSEDPKWIPRSVDRILHNELYTGMMVQGKNQKINYKVKKSRKLEPDEWIRVADTHDAIITQGEFDCVQELLLLDTRTSPGEESVYLFSGFLRCRDCGQNMIRRTAMKKGKKYFYYHCSTYKNGDGCSSHNFSAKKMETVVLNAIQTQIALIDDVEKTLSQIGSLPEERVGVKMIDRQIAELAAEAEHYRDMKVKLYQDMVEGIVSREEYPEISRRFLEKAAAADSSREGLEKKRKSLLSRNMEPQGWMKEFQQYRNVKTLVRRMLVVMVDHIDVCDGGRVEVHFNYEDELMELLELVMEPDMDKKRKAAAV